jgi:hypothetical protein
MPAQEIVLRGLQQVQSSSIGRPARINATNCWLNMMKSSGFIRTPRLRGLSEIDQPRARMEIGSKPCSLRR